MTMLEVSGHMDCVCARIDLLRGRLALGDIPRLVWHIVNRRQAGLNRNITSIPASVFSSLRLRAWPGNIRELENVIERGMIHSTGRTLLLDDEPGLRLSARSQEVSTLEDIEGRPRRGYVAAVSVAHQRPGKRC
jgi:transcriptional regulator with PAS, ATPase and Fis domain